MTLEGGDTFKPITNALSSVAKGVTDVVKGVVQPVYNATLKNIPGVDNALVNLDKSVGKAIPGGWGTVASVAASFIPGAQLAALGMTQAGLATGLGALTGSGVMRKGHNFNLQGAIMGGAMAYGASQLAQGLQNAADPATNATTKAIEEAAKTETGQIAANLGVENASTGIGSQARMLAEQNAGFGSAGLESIKSGANQAIQSNLINTASNTGLSNLAANPDVFSGLAGTQQAIAQPTGLQTLGTNLTEIGKGTLSNIADAGQGIKNLTGFGPEGMSGISKAATAFAEPITKTGLAAGVIGYSGMAALEEQQKQLDQQLASGSIGQAAYDAAKAKIDEQVEAAKATVAANPLQTSADTSNVTEGPSLYTKKSTGFDTLYDKKPTGGTTLYEQSPVKVAGGGIINYYAMGGNVQMNPPDDQTGMINHTPMTNFDQSNTQTGIMSMIGNAAPRQAFAAGGMPRFLSGGGDGMSDSIKASINGTQEARLADGEFVIPADVVSHIGNGSSKAGAKQLYSMMDKVRKARTGNPKQGKQINPRKYLAA